MEVSHVKHAKKGSKIERIIHRYQKSLTYLFVIDI